MKNWLHNRKRILLQILLVFLILFGCYEAQNLSYVDSADAYSFIPAEEWSKMQETNDAFETTDEVGIIILKTEKNWFTPEGLKALQAITASLSASDSVHPVSSLANLEIIERSPLSIATRNPITYGQKRGKSPKDLMTDYPDITGKFISENGKFALLYYPKVIIPEKIKTLLAPQDSFYSNVFFYGAGDLNEEIQSNAQYNLILTGGVGFLLIGLVFFLFVRKLNALFLILIFTAFNLALVVLFMRVLNISIGPHMTAIPSLIMVMSFSDIMHLIYHHHSFKEKSSYKTIKRRLRFPMIFTSVTNGIGFFIYLLVSENLYVTQLALIALFGILVAYFSARILVLPLLSPTKMYLSEKIKSKINQWHLRYYSAAKKHTRIILFIFFLTTAGLIIFTAFKVQIESSSRNFTEADSDLTQGQQILEEHFFGNQQITLIVHKKEKNTILTYAERSQLETLEKQISNLLHPSYVNSPLLVLKRYNRYRAGGHPSALKLSKRTFRLLSEDFNRIAPLLGWKEVVSKDKKYMRFQFGFYSNELNQRLLLYEKIQDLIATVKLENGTLTLSGLSYWQDLGESRFIQLVFIGFLIAILCAGLIMLFVLRSFWKITVFIFVNLLPLAFALTLMFLFSIPLNTVSVFMLAVLIGLCLDDSIYLISLSKPSETPTGIYPIVVTTLVLAAGMLSLLFSNYHWLQPFALVFFGAFMVSLIADSLILPLLMIPKKQVK